MRQPSRTRPLRTHRGYEFHVRESAVPFIMPRLLNSVIYLYRSVDDACERSNAGGIGFLVAVPFEDSLESAFRALYAVTAEHVAKQYPVILVNTLDGNFDVIPASSGHWDYADEHDLAVHSGGITEDIHKFGWVDMEFEAVTERLMTVQKIGPGDETFMIGRFVNHEGKNKNTPTIRFGNISMGIGEEIRTKRRSYKEAFLVEAHSMPGYSGSPVFVYIPAFTPREDDIWMPKVKFSEQRGPWLLGVDCAHTFTFEQLRKDQDSNPEKDAPGVSTATGLMVVVPTWRLQELLMKPELVADRHAAWMRIKANTNGPVELD